MSTLGVQRIFAVLASLELIYPSLVHSLETSIPEHQLAPRNFNPHPYIVASTFASNFEHPYAKLAMNRAAFKKAKHHGYPSTKRLDKFHKNSIKSLEKFARDYLGLSPDGTKIRRVSPHSTSVFLGKADDDDVYAVYPGASNPLGRQPDAPSYSEPHNHDNGAFLPDPRINSRSDIIPGTIHLARVQSDRHAVPLDLSTDVSARMYRVGADNEDELSPIDAPVKFVPLTNYQEDLSREQNSVGAYQNLAIAEEPMYETRTRQRRPALPAPAYNNFVDEISPDNRFYSSSLRSDFSRLIRFHE